MSHQAELTPAELAARLGGQVCVRTLANWRCTNPRRGPGFVKRFGRVRYPLDQVQAWENEQGITTHETV